MAFRRLPRPLPPAHRGDRYPTRRQAGQHGACLGRSGRTPPVSIGMGGPRCSTITRRPCLFSAVCTAVAPDRPLCFPQIRAHKPCFRRPLVPQTTRRELLTSTDTDETRAPVEVRLPAADLADFSYRASCVQVRIDKRSVGLASPVGRRRVEPVSAHRFPDSPPRGQYSLGIDILTTTADGRATPNIVL